MPSRTTTRSKDNTTTGAQTTLTQARSGGASINQTILLGRLCAAPQLHITTTGKHVSTVRVATNERNGHAEFHSVVLWGQLADFATNYLGKGRLVAVVGRLQTRTWTASDGTTRYSAEIVASRLQALPAK